MNAPNPALYAALSAAQSKIGHASKDANNPHFKSKYASLPAVLDAIREPFADNGLALIQAPSLTAVNGAPPLLSVETIIAHKDGGTISCVLSCSLADGKPQTVGSAISYLRRYGAMALAGVAASEEDDDGEAAQGRSKAPAKVATVTGEVVKAKPAWLDDQKTEAGQYRTDIEAFGDAASAEFSALWRRMQYDAPSDVIDALAALLLKWQDIQAHTSQEPAP